MPSDKQIAANRKNATNSTGPKSVEGKQRSRRNALSHGLSIPVSADPALRDDIEVLARIIGSTLGETDVSECSREAAQAQTDILRIRKIRATLLNVLCSPPCEEFPQAGIPKTLASLERYERRAMSRRKRALREI
jgi:hypothetical protein